MSLRQEDRTFDTAAYPGWYLVGEKKYGTLTECGGLEVSVVSKHRTPDGVESNIDSWLGCECVGLELDGGP